MRLIDEILRRIAREGPMTVADYIGLCLTHPSLGYYMKGDPFGAPKESGGDFITAPEISQMFGELIGLWCAETWQRIGRPSRCLLVELGPGRGSLMADALRACRALPAFLEAAEIHLVEVSPSLRELQRRSLAGHDVEWCESLAGLPEAPLLLVANEFFDALPVRQFERTPDGWSERLVVAAPDGRSLAFGLAPPSPLNAALIAPTLRDAEPGSAAELCPAGLSLGATLQALRRHQRHEVLQDPGAADLTAHVDFQSLAEAAVACGAQAFGPVAQGAFLRALGIETRAARLAKAAPDKRGEIESALKRLTEPAGMGRLFKVLCLASPPSLVPGLALPAGFSQA